MKRILCKINPVLLVLCWASFFLSPLAKANWKNFESADAIVGRTKLTSDRNFFRPDGVAVSSGGKLYVADQAYNRVLRYSSANALSNGQPAEAVFGQSDFLTSEPGLGASSLSGPERLTVDSSGNLWVSDSGNSRILRWASADTALSGSAAVQVLGQPNFVTNDFSTSQTGLNNPKGLVVDSLGRLWVADTDNNRVLRYDNAVSKGNGGAADGVLGQPDYTSNSSGASQTALNGVHDVAVDAQSRLWVGDTFNSRVLRFDTPASQLQPPANGVLGQANFTDSSIGWAPGRMGYSGSLRISPAGVLFVADSSNSRIMRFDSAAAKANGASADGVLGSLSLASGSSSPGTAGELAQIGSIHLDASGRLWVTDRSYERVLRWDTAAAKANGALADGVVGDTAPAVVSALPNLQLAPFFPRAGLQDPVTGKWFIADYGRVLRYSGPGAAEAGAAPEAFLGKIDGTAIGGSASSSNLRDAWGVALGSNGTLWVSDPSGHRILGFANAATAPTGVAATVVLGQADFTSSNQGLAQNRLSEPRGLALDASGNLYVADYGNHRVLRFNNVAAKSSGANADAVIGQADFVTATAGPAGNRLKSPSDVEIDTSARLWVADTGSSRVLRYDSPLAVAPLGAFSGRLGGFQVTTPEGMSSPIAIAIDANGRLWVADNSFQRITRFDKAAIKADGAAADGVLGQTNFNDFRDSTRSSRRFGYSEAIFVTSFGSLWVAETGQSRLLRFTPDVAATITQEGFNGLGKYAITFKALEAGTFVVSSSTDLKDWTAEGTYPLGAGISQLFTDTKGGPKRFFRIDEP